IDRQGWEAMPAVVEPDRVSLAPNATARVRVTVGIPGDGVPAGGHERQRLVAAAGDLPEQELELVTAREVARPSIQFTAAGWQAVRDKVAKYEWARQQQEELVRVADAWKVPEAALPPNNIAQGHVYVFQNEEFLRLLSTTHAWQLTRKPEYAQKVALFLRRLADPGRGYPATFAGTSLGEPQEGGNFQGVAIAYDAILDAQVLGADDRRALERMFRIYLETIRTPLATGNVGNWNVAAATSGLFVALAIGDLAAAERYLYGTCGFADFLTKGVMDDGWWWECSTSYNFWVAEELTQCALAAQPWGIDLLHRGFPVVHSPRTTLTPWATHPILGMSFDKWGPVHRNTRSLKQLWDSVSAMTDYRGVIFGINDGHEQRVAGRFDVGYYAFRDPSYVPALRLSNQRSLLYGVPELPDTTAAPYLESTLAENLGIAQLRSQDPQRPPRERINAGFKIGTQGGFHGHFDRVSLNSLTRHGRSFWNPESIWWSYGNYLYKFYVQTSVAHNMVVVDQQQQEAVPSVQRLFHAGRMMQVSVQETHARWADPPYGGMEYDAADASGALKGFDAGMRHTRQSVPLADDRKQGELGPFSDRVLQRRVGIVMDDYVVMADYLRGEHPHVFDNLLQLRGFEGLQAAHCQRVRHEAQFNADPHSAAQFITDCDWYQADAPLVGRFLIQEGKGDENQQNEPGVLRMDVHSLWPVQQEIMIAQPPENLGGPQWVTYEVSADGKPLARGESGMWALGAVEIDVPVTGARELVITVKTDGFGKKDALFLGRPRLVAADGTATPLARPPFAENIRQPATPGQDYYGGPVKLAGLLQDSVVAAQPADSAKPGVIRIQIDNKNAARFKATLGGDYPFGDESRRRKVLGIRSHGTSARFLTVIEPHEGKPTVKSAVALDANRLRVELIDGRVQEIDIRNLEGPGGDIRVDTVETRAGKEIRRESTAVK
ncbi:MAG: hypothetical protein WCJ14_10535, partial [Verrucomicrobiota bacterium]